MTTTTRTTAARTILALDLGKYKSVACLYDRATAAATFDSIPTSRAELLRLFRRHRPPRRHQELQPCPAGRPWPVRPAQKRERPPKRPQGPFIVGRFVHPLQIGGGRTNDRGRR